jgi:hypothetical protein
MRELLREDDDDERETLLLLLLLIFICGWFRIFWPSIEDVGCYAIHRNDE